MSPDEQELSFRLLSLAMICATIALCVVERGWPWRKP